MFDEKQEKEVITTGKEYYKDRVFNTVCSICGARYEHNDVPVKTFGEDVCLSCVGKIIAHTKGFDDTEEEEQEDDGNF
jgi:ribulose 1,5-bisphosphate carboxylase large subunit-like protein